MMRTRLRPPTHHRSLHAATALALALAGVVLAGCVPGEAAPTASAPQQSLVRSVLSLFDDSGQSRRPHATPAPQPVKEPVQPAGGIPVPNGSAYAGAPAGVSRIMLREHDLRLRPASSGADGYQIALPQLAALGGSAAEGEQLLLRRIQELLQDAGASGRYNQKSRLMTLRATPEQGEALGRTLEALRRELAFARYGIELWSGRAVEDLAARGAVLPVGAPQNAGVNARAVATASVSAARLEAAGAKRLQNTTHLALVGEGQAQFSYAAPVDYVASTSSLDGSVNMTVERFSTLLRTLIQTRRLPQGAETTLTLLGKGIEGFREDNTAAMAIKVPMPKTVSARVPYMPVADRAVVITGLRGFGQPCLKSGSYCPYEMAGDLAPQDRSMTVLVRAVVYMAEALPERAQPQPVVKVPGGATLQSDRAGRTLEKAPPAPTSAQEVAARSMPAAGKPEEVRTGVSRTVQPVWNNRALSSSGLAESQKNLDRPKIVPAPVTPVTVARDSASIRAIAGTVSGKPSAGTPSGQDAFAASKGFRPKPALAPVAVVRGRPDDQSNPVGERPPAARQRNVLDLMEDTPRGKLVERPTSPVRPMAPASGGAAAPLPKDPKQVDWAAWDAELEASVGEGGNPALAALSAGPVGAGQTPPPTGATVIRKPSGAHVFRGAPGVKISPEAMKRLMELDARRAHAAAQASQDGTLLGTLRDKAHMQGVMMVYDKDKEKP